MYVTNIFLLTAYMEFAVLRDYVAASMAAFMR